MQFSRPAFVVALLMALLPASAARADLTADNLLLVCNGNSKRSISTAEFYAQKRNVPLNRILKLDLPGSEEIPFETYERNVVPPIRQFLRDQKLVGEVKCIVLFYGTPIRVSPPKIDETIRAELATINNELTSVQAKAVAAINDFDTFVAAEVPGYTTEPANPSEAIEAAQVRYNHAVQGLSAALETADPAAKQRLGARLVNIIQVLFGDVGVLSRLVEPQATSGRATTQTIDAYKTLKAKVTTAQSRLAELSDRRYDLAERARARDIFRDIYGAFDTITFLRDQAGYFGTTEAQASLDSELSLLWLNNYDRNRWLTNPLYYKNTAYSGPRPLMVSRIDGPDEDSAGLLLLASLKAEREGLKGKAVVDSRGIQLAPGNGYSVYDESLRRLAHILRKVPALPLVFDEKDPVLPAGSVKDVALYAGWYSVNNYIPSCRFVPGAIGFHIASFEMTTLRDPKTKAWVPNLIKDGVAATLGPVSEPYLHAFPDADEFFSLLLTGKLTLAECYWRTQKTASWQVALIGDPLYRPFAKNPQLKEEDLPVELRKALK